MAVEVVIDTCCMINLLATEREVEIIESLDYEMFDTEYTKSESHMLWSQPDADGNRGQKHRSTASLRAAGLLRTRLIDSDALVDAFVRAASQICDPDASCIALAGGLEIPLVTDDRKERRIAKELFPSIEQISTLDMIREASEILSWDDATMIEVVGNLRWRGNFAPPRNDENGSWYAMWLQRAGITL